MKIKENNVKDESSKEFSDRIKGNGTQKIRTV